MANDSATIATEQGRATAEGILEIITAYNDAGDDWIEQERIQEEIYERPLEICVRRGIDGWESLGCDRDDTPTEYYILLCTGGPAIRIVGGLDKWGVPDSAPLECQNWFTPWMVVDTSAAEDDALEQFAQMFYYGEGS